MILHISIKHQLARILSAGVLFIVCGLLAGAAPPECGISMNSLPEIQEFRGLRLGMTVDEVKLIVPIIEVPHADEFGMARTSFSPDFAPKLDKKRFESIRTVSLEFFDQRLASIWVGFNGGFKWQSIDSAIEGLSTELHLPPEWQTKPRERQLVCGDFRLGVSLVSNSPSIRIINDKAKLEWQIRRDAKVDAEP